MELHDLIASAADRFVVPRPLVLAVCEQESAFDPWAWNPEPRYRYLWDVLLQKPFRKLTPAEDASEIPPLDFAAYRGVPTDAEWRGQQASWGLMQVMGAVAPEQVEERVEIVRHGHRVQDEVESVRLLPHLVGVLRDDYLMGTQPLRVGGLARRGREHHHVRTESIGQLDRHVPQPPEADHANRVALSRPSSGAEGSTS